MMQASTGNTRENSRFWLSEALDSQAQLYRIREINGVGNVYYFCTPNNSKTDSWKLSLIIFRNEFQRVDNINIKEILEQAVGVDCKGLLNPDLVDIVMAHTSNPHDQNCAMKVHRQTLNEKVNLIELVIPESVQEAMLDSEFKTRKEFDDSFTVKPFAVKFLITLLSIAFIIQVIVEHFYPDQINFEVIGVNSLNLASGNYLGLLGGTLIHGNTIHFLMNVLALVYLSTHLSRFYSTRLQLSTYLFSTFTGIMGSLAVAKANSIGSSGAIFGLLGALLVCLQRKQIVIKNNVYWGLQLRSLKKSLLICLAISILLPFIFPKIDAYGHLGGFLGGMIFASQLKGVGWSLRIGGMILALILINPWWTQVREQKQWALNVIQKGEMRITVRDLLLNFMNESLSEIINDLQVLIALNNDHVQALYSARLEKMKRNLRSIREHTQFQNEVLLQKYFDCIQRGFNLAVDVRKDTLKNQWFEEYLGLEKEVMDYYGISKVERKE